MEEFYKKILNKPKAYRIRLAYGLTVFLGLIIFSLWMAITVKNVNHTLGDIQKGESLQQKLPSLKEKYQEQENATDEIKEGLKSLGY